MSTSSANHLVVARIKIGTTYYMYSGVLFPFVFVQFFTMDRT